MRNIFTLMLLAATLLTSCEKEIGTDSNGLSSELQQVNALIASAGKLPTKANKNESKVIKADTLPGIIPDYIDPYSGVSYDAMCVEKTTRYDMVSNPMEFVTLDPWSNIWPGALVQGGSLAKGIPATIPIYAKRKPGRITLKLVSGSENMDEWYKDVPMRDSVVMQAQNDLMKKYLGSSIPARTSFEIKAVQSVEEMAVKLGINLELFGAKLGTEFGTNWNQKKSYVAVKLNQIFFTMGYEGPDGGFRGAFTDDIRASDLANYTGFGNPICYVGSVSYGRSFILLYESNYSSQDTESAISASYRKYGSSDVTSKQKKILNESTSKMVQIGGNPVEGLETVFGNFTELEKFLNNAIVSKDNVGAPLSYAIYYLKDNTFASLSNMLDYEVTTKTYYPVTPTNDVVIDVLSLYVSRPVPRDDRHKVSNYTNVKIKSIRLKTQDTENTARTYFLDKNPRELERRGNEHGNNITLSGAQFLPQVAKNQRLTIECFVEVYNELYYGDRYKESREVLLTRTYECTPQGQWRAVSDGASSNSDTFTSIKRTEIITDATVDLDLKIRFVHDGIVLE